MILFLGIVALLNLGLGFGVAILAAHPWPELRVSLRGQRKASSLVQKPTESSAPANNTPEVTAHEALDLPSGWRDRLVAQQVIPRSPLEAALHVARIEGDAQRARWIALQSSLKAIDESSSHNAARALFESLATESNASILWCNKLLQFLEQHRDKFAEGEHALSEQLRELLLNLSARLELLGKSQTSIGTSDIQQAIRREFLEISAAFESSCLLREFVLECLAADALVTNRLDLLPNAWQRDSATGLPNRLGIEVLLADWTAADPSHKRLISGALIEIDRLGKLNERLGIQQSNQVIQAFGKLVEGVVRSDRGDRVARVGSAMFVLLPDAGVAGAKAAAERIRQTVEAATFKCHDEEFTLAANCAVCDYLFEDTPADLLKRLALGVAEAKRGGRNRTAIDEGPGPVLFDAQPVHVRARTINVNGE